VELDRAGGGAENEGVLTVSEGVQDDLECVGFTEVRVTSAFTDDDPVWLPIVEVGSDVEGIGVVNDANLGPLARGAPFHGLVLNEVRQRDGVLPGGVVQSSVDGRSDLDGGGRAGSNGGSGNE